MTVPNYSLVDLTVCREALNFQATSPSSASLSYRIQEAAQRVEGLTRLALASADWEYSLDEDDLRGEIVVPGLYAVGVDPTITVTDDNGDDVSVSSTVQGIGDEVLVELDSGTFLEQNLPLKVQITRGVTASQLPGDLRAAIVTQCEQILDGFSPAAESSIIRTCSRYGWVG